MPHVPQSRVAKVPNMKKVGKGFLSNVDDSDQTIKCFCFASASTEAFTIFIEVVFQPVPSGSQHPFFHVRINYCTKPPNFTIGDEDLDVLQDIYDVCCGGPPVKLVLDEVQYITLEQACKTCLQDASSITTSRRNDRGRVIKRLIKATPPEKLKVASLARDLTKACNEAISIESLGQVLGQYADDFSNNSKAAFDQGKIGDWTNRYWSLSLHLVKRKLRETRDNEKDPATNSVGMTNSIANDLLLPLGRDAFDVFARFAVTNTKLAFVAQRGEGERQSFTDEMVMGLLDMPPHVGCFDFPLPLACIAAILRKRDSLNGVEGDSRKCYETDACRLLGLPNLAALRLHEVPEGEVPDFRALWAKFEAATPQVGQLRQFWSRVRALYLSAGARASGLRNLVRHLKNGEALEAIRESQSPEDAEEPTLEEIDRQNLVKEVFFMCQERLSDLVDAYANRPTCSPEHQHIPSEALSESAAHGTVVRKGAHDGSKPSASHSSPGCTRSGATTAAWGDTSAMPMSGFNADEAQTLLPEDIDPESTKDLQQADLNEGQSITKEGLHTPPATNPTSHHFVSQSGTIDVVEGLDQHNSDSNVFPEIGPAVRITSDLVPPDISQDSQWLQQLNSVDMPGQPDIGFEITPQPHQALDTLAAVATGEAPLPLGDDSAALYSLQSPWLSRPLSSSSAYPDILNPAPTAGPDPPAVDWRAVKMEQVDRLLYDIPTPNALVDAREITKKRPLETEAEPATVKRGRNTSSSESPILMKDADEEQPQGQMTIAISPPLPASPDKISTLAPVGPNAATPGSPQYAINRIMPRSIIQDIVLEHIDNIIGDILLLSGTKSPLVSLMLPRVIWQTQFDSSEPASENIGYGEETIELPGHSVSLEKIQGYIKSTGFGKIYWNTNGENVFVTMEVLDEELAAELGRE